MKNKMVVEKILKYISKILEYTKKTQTMMSSLTTQFLLRLVFLILAKSENLQIRLIKIFRKATHQFHGEFCMVFETKSSTITKV